MYTPISPPNRSGAARHRWAVLLSSLFLFTLSSLAQAPWGSPLTPPGVAAATCAAPSVDPSGTPIPASAGYTFGLMDVRGPASTTYGGCVPTAPLWHAPMYHHPSWNAQELGNVFGITLDARGNMYVAAHGLYGAYRPFHHRYGDIGGGPTDLNAAGTVYKIDHLTGVVTVFAVIPGQQVMALSGGLMSGPGLGNLSYDAVHAQFFVTSLEDGKIYRVDSAGSVVGSFDPMGPDNGAAGMPPKRERLWAVEVHRGAVYYSVWNSGTPADPVKIRRVSLLPGGAFDPISDTEVLTVPGKSHFYPSIPVADLTFSRDGQTMVLGERTMRLGTYSYNHRSGTHLATLSGGTWSVTKTMATGCNASQGEGYGGVAFGDDAGDPEGVIWTTSADMRTGWGPHGLYGVRTADFPVSGHAPQSWKVPYDPSYVDAYVYDVKGSGGDVEILREERCAKLVVGQVSCPDRPGAPYTTTLTLTNLSSNTAAYAVLTPCPPASLPSTATTGQPRPTGVITLPTALATGDTTTIGIQIPSNAGPVFCFQVTLLTRAGEECCTEKTCVRLPDCGCAELVDHKIDCELQADGTVKYTIVMAIRNLTGASGAPYPFGYATILPPAGFSPSLLSPTPDPIVPGATGTFKTCYFGTPGTVCFNLALHDPEFESCCAIDLCLKLPPCGDAKPDTCAIPSRVACCPPDGIAEIPFTICNHASVPRTYTWTATGLVSAACTKTLGPADFSPSTGTLGPIAPGACLTGTLKVRCRNFDFGDCARVELCFQHHPTAPPLCCATTVYRPRPDVPVVKVKELPTPLIGDPARVHLEISNPGDAAIRTALFIASEDGYLLLGEGKGDGMTQQIRLAPGEATDVVANVRLPEDVGADIALLALFIGADGLHNVATATDRILIPIPLSTPRTAVGALQVSAIAIEASPQPQVVMQVLTTSGHRYRVEQSPGMDGDWQVSTCTVQDVVTGADGVFLGTGGNVTCRVPCGAGEGLMFFRIRDLSLD